MSTVYIVVSGGGIPSPDQMSKIIELLPGLTKVDTTWIVGYEGDLSKSLGFENFIRVTTEGKLRIETIQQAHLTLQKEKEGLIAVFIATYGDWDDANHLGVWKSEYTEAGIAPVRIFESTAGPSQALIKRLMRQKRRFPPVDVTDIGPGI